jgi:hypothetical protein
MPPARAPARLAITDRADDGGAMTRWQLGACALVLVAAGTTGCSDSGSDSAAATSTAATSSAAVASPVCAALDQLQASVDQLTQVQLTQDGLGALRTALSAVGTDVGQLVDAGSSQLQPEVTGLQTDLTAIGDTVDAAAADPSVAALRAVGSTVSTLVGDVGTLTQDVGGSC